MKSGNTKLIGNAWVQRALILCVIVLIMAVFQRSFFSWNNMRSILLAISIYGIMSCGMLLAMLVGGIDLAMGSTAALTSCVALLYYNTHGCTTAACITGILLALLIACAVGTVHGVLDAYLHLPAFVVTLATSNLLYGLATALIGGKFVHLSDTSGLYYKLGNAKLLSIPMPVIVFIVVAIIVALVLQKTTYGRRVYATGGNSIAAEIVGIKSKVIRVSCYVICSISAAIGGIILSSMNLVTSCKTAQGYEMMVMLALVVGGANIMGGEGSIGGAVFGALLAGIIDNIIVLLGVDTNYSQAVQGVIIVLAVGLNVYSSRKSMGLTAPKRHKIRKTTAAPAK